MALSDDPAVKLCIAVQLVFDHVVALARSVFQSCSIQNADRTPCVVNQLLLFEDRRRRRDRRTSRTQHFGEIFLRERKCLAVRAVRTKQQPAGESLLDLMFGIACSGLHHLNELCLNILQGKLVKGLAKA